MHICPKCGTQFEGKFCPECGEKFVEQTNCPNCNAPIVPGAKFCPECGSPYAAAQPQQQPQQAHTRRFPARKKAPKKPLEELSEEERAVLLNAKVKRWRAHMTISFWALFSIFPYTLAFVIPLIQLFATLGQKTVDWNPGNLGKERKKMLVYTVLNTIFFLATLITVCIVSPMLFGLSGMPDFFAPLMVSLFGMIVVMYGIGAVIGAASIPLGQQLTVDFYGRSDPIYEVDAPVVTMPEVNKARAIAVHSGNVAVKPAPDFFHLGAIGAALLYIVIAVIVVFAVLGGNKITLANAQRIGIGNRSWGKNDVRDLLGDPYVAPYDKENDYRWEYYDSTVLGLMEDYNDLEKEAEEAFMNGDFGKIDGLEKEAEEIQEKIEELEFGYMRIEYDTENGYVKSVLFDAAHRMDGKTDEKRIGEYHFSATSVSSKSDMEELTLEVIYEDDSYWHLLIGNYILIGEETSTGSGKYKITVIDPFGGKIETTMSFSENYFDDI